MSDGKSDARHAEREASEVEEAACKLARALLRVRNGPFGIPQSAIDIVNEELELAGLDVRFEKKIGR